jgi:hypothetical protein
VSCPAANVDESSVHFAPHPISSVAGDVDFAAGHLAADVPAGVSLDMDLARFHVSADPVDAGQVAFELEPTVAGIAAELKELGERQFFIAVKELPLFELSQWLVAREVWRKAFDLDGDRRGGVVS